MKRVLIATTNNDKYNAVVKVFRKTIFPSDEYIIEKLTNDMNVPEEKEQGSNIDRARAKATNAFNYLKNYEFDYIVGLDDAIIIEGKKEPNVKEYINRILYENYLAENEEYEFNRAYCIIDKTEKMYEVNISIPYIYKSLKNFFEIKDNSYPLSVVAYPLGYDKPICELSEEDETSYYLKYVSERLMNLQIKD